MRIEIVASTSRQLPNFKEEFDELGGELAGICYMPHTFEDIKNQPLERKLARANMVKSSGHHSIFDHEYVTLYLEDVPKMFAILLNNEKAYNTSEKSGRYTKMVSTGMQADLYAKWTKILEKEIKQRYGEEQYFDDKRIKKLALENARLFLSIYTPTSLAYTVSFRQLNYLYAWLEKLQDTDSPLLMPLCDTAGEFCKNLEDLNLIDPDLVELGKTRDFSLLAKRDMEEYFGDTYTTKYKGSLVEYAQAQRHRTLNYQLSELPTPEYYIPPLVEEYDKLRDEWIKDMLKVEEFTPSGSMVQIYERGTPEAFVLKMRERLCTCAQLEICDQTKKTLDKYLANTKNPEIIKMLEPYTKGARCLAGYNCKNKCAFHDGIT
ncbi:MAG TPA: hypothetical protein DD621_05555, partial [Clostridiales bacterium]|nr:hypothetical protein [Clostridiales bacterium]